MKHLLVSMQLFILIAFNAYGAEPHKDSQGMCHIRDVTCPSIRWTKDEVIPLTLKYLQGFDNAGKSVTELSGRTTFNVQCTVPACLSSPCMNRGHCREDISGFICDCVGGYGGSLCQRTKPMCQENPCGPTGSCYDDPTIGFYCLCDQCSTGEFCEQEFDRYYDPISSFSLPPDGLQNQENTVSMDTYDVYYLALPELAISTNCDERYAPASTAWEILTPNGTIPVITLYEFYTDSSSCILLVANWPVDTSRLPDLKKPYEGMELYVPAEVPGERPSDVIFLVQDNVRDVLPFTGRARSNKMYVFWGSFYKEALHSVLAKVRAVHPDQS